MPHAPRTAGHQGSPAPAETGGRPSEEPRSKDDGPPAGPRLTGDQPPAETRPTGDRPSTGPRSSEDGPSTGARSTGDRPSTGSRPADDGTPEEARPADGGPSKGARTAVDKALDLVEAVGRAPRPPRLTELADEVGLHRATAYRILLDLVRRGWVLRAGDRYLPGTAVLLLSSRAAHNSLTSLARPVLTDLSAGTGLMVNLQVLERTGSRVVDVVRPDRLAMISTLLGEALPVHRFAGPLALVAALPPEARGPYLDVAREAGHPMAGPGGLSADLARTEADGFAVEHGRNDRFVASVSRAVTPVAGAPVCALTVVGPDAEIDADRLERLRDALASAVDTLTGLLAGTAREAAG
ncbi:helix-turn-helix domain-containing protein [Streptomyces sp. ACT015]|uniref:IclR family transcriptional regulator n=1 Tax=Streptomyces sp. ACT015 TaxID=3134807 RepID=UPI003D16CFFC